MTKNFLSALSLGLALTVPSAFATSIGAGGSTPGTNLGPLTGLTLLASVSGSGSQSGGGTTLTASWKEWVYKVNSTSDLDFIIQATNSGTDVIEDVTTGSFAGFITDVGYTTSVDGTSSGGTVHPDTITRSINDATIKFGFNGGFLSATTTDLVIQTNAKSYIPGGVSIQDTNSINGPGYEPAVPEPMTMGLLGGGLALLGISRLRRSRKK